MFKKALAKLSLLLFVAVFLVPAGRLHAQASGTEIDPISGTDPQPTGEPRPRVMSTNPSMLDELMLVLSMWV